MKFTHPITSSPVALACVLCLGLVPPNRSLAQGSAEEYERWRTYGSRTRGLVYRDSVEPNWFGENSDRFWYRIRTGKSTHEFVLVNASEGTRQPAFDHPALSRQLNQQAGLNTEPSRLDLQRLSFDETLQTCRFRIAGSSWTFDLPDGPLAKAGPEFVSRQGRGDDGLTPLRSIRRSLDGGSQRTPIRFDNRLSQRLEIFWVMDDGELRSYGTVDAKSSEQLSTFGGHAWLLKSEAGENVAAFVASDSAELAVIDAKTPKPAASRARSGRRERGRRTTSPDRKWRVAFDQNNVVVFDESSGEPVARSENGDDAESYGGRVWWSPDSKHFVVMKTRRGQRRKINLIDSAPDDSIHAELITIDYAKPGDEIDQSRPVLFDIEHWEPRSIDNATFANPYSLTDLAWHQSGASFSFVYNQRGHQVLRLISVDARSATPRTVIDETSETFICYSYKKYVERLDDAEDVIWMSERSGWNHLYRIDFETGKVKNAITSGEWVVRDVVRTEPIKNRIWLEVSGVDSEQDPYQRHLIRVDLDGKNLTRITSGDGDHRWRFSPNGQYLIDEYSRVDLPPVTQLCDAETGKILCPLESADASALMETGWRPPERFVAKGRDGQTDIHGIIVRPTRFDPQRSYPVLEAIYAGPHSAFVPKTFGLQSQLYTMAELGFIIVKIDGMGTNHRSKAFHDVCWQNLGDSGFPDRIAWIKAAANSRPEMDLSRVGIWGGSAGGQSAMRALIAHGDFYHAAVADCGCHDNRVDKIWWNEQWMGWPIGPHYRKQSNVTGASRLKGDLMLIWGELDRNVDPASSMQVVDALIRADKDFEQLIMPGVGHGAAGHPYARRRQADFFVRKLGRGRSEPPPSNAKDRQQENPRP